MTFFPGGLNRPRRKVLLALVALSVVTVSLVLGLAASAQSFDEQTLVPTMSFARAYHTATLLPDGRVLVVGGNDSVTTAELYDPALNQWTAAGNLSSVRIGHTATLLPNGQVLVLSGSYYSTSARAELYDPTTRRWRLDGEPQIRRSAHTATLLNDGNVLVAGGDIGNSITTAELYTAATGQWSDTGNMSTVRFRHTATLLPDGRVLAAGGGRAPFLGGSAPLTAAEIYDPASGEWHSTGPMKEQHDAHTATLLPDGRVLAVGTLPFNGSPYPGPSFPPLLPGAEVYSSTTNTWAAGAPLSTPRWGHTATLLLDGRVVIIGGYSWYGQVLSSVEIFDPVSNRWYAARSLTRPRVNHTATLLADGTILVVGGISQFGATDTAERYDPRDALLDIQHYLSSFIHSAAPPVLSPTFVPFFPTPTPSP
jgi:hypothetical protein